MQLILLGSTKVNSRNRILSYPGSEQVENKTQSKYWGQNITFVITEPKLKDLTLVFSQDDSASRN